MIHLYNPNIMPPLNPRNKTAPPLLLIYPGNKPLGEKIQSELHLSTIDFTLRTFPDQESYVRILSDVKERDVWILCSLNNPNEKFLPLHFLGNTLKDQKANSVGLIAPYLGYLRQDKAFHEGEAITSRYFAKLISKIFDSIITIDPHLHRYGSLSEIYSISSQVLHAGQPISEWIQANIPNPILIGPDMESEQWVAEVANKVGSPHLVLQKKRKGDREVEVSLDQSQNFSGYTPVLLDDIISSAQTMNQAVQLLIKEGANPPVCIGVHAVMNQETYDRLLKSGAKQVVTCNTITHPSNKIDVSKIITEALCENSPMKN